MTDDIERFILGSRGDAKLLRDAPQATVVMLCGNPITIIASLADDSRELRFLPVQPSGCLLT